MSEPTPARPEVVDLTAWPPGEGADGVVWTLGPPSELNVNLVRVGPGGEMHEHVNTEVDVLVVVVAGRGELTVDGVTHALGPASLAHVPAGARRALRAGDDAFTYLSIHRRRSGPSIRPAPPGPR